jgi:porin
VPQEDRSVAHWYVDFGLKLKRPFPGRDEDVLSLGFAYLSFSDDYVDFVRASGDDVSGRASVLELSYRFQVTGWLTLQPDLQFFFDPHFSRRDATVIGLRAVIEL